MKVLTRLLSFFAGLTAVLVAVGAIGAWLIYEHYSQGLPDYYQLAAYDPPVTTRVYAGDGRLLAEYAVENRVFVPISAIPKRVINAFLAADLVDELVLDVAPALEDEGFKLILPKGRHRPLALLETKPLGGGVVQLRYDLRAR